MKEPIGRVIATEKVPTTMDKFTFWTNADFKLHAFDIVKVNRILILTFIILYFIFCQKGKKIEILTFYRASQIHSFRKILLQAHKHYDNR